MMDFAKLTILRSSDSFMYVQKGERRLGRKGICYEVTLFTDPLKRCSLNLLDSLNAAFCVEMFEDVGKHVFKPVPSVDNVPANTLGFSVEKMPDRKGKPQRWLLKFHKLRAHWNQYWKMKSVWAKISIDKDCYVIFKITYDKEKEKASRKASRNAFRRKKKMRARLKHLLSNGMGMGALATYAAEYAAESLTKKFPTSPVKNEPMLSPERATVQSLIDAYPHISEKEPEDDNTKLQSLLDVCNDMAGTQDKTHKNGNPDSPESPQTPTEEEPDMGSPTAITLSQSEEAFCSKSAMEISKFIFENIVNQLESLEAEHLHLVAERAATIALAKLQRPLNRADLCAKKVLLDADAKDGVTQGNDARKQLSSDSSADKGDSSSTSSAEAYMDEIIGDATHGSTPLMDTENSPRPSNSKPKEKTPSLDDIAMSESCHEERLYSSGAKDRNNLLVIGGSKRIYNPQRTGKEGRFVKNKRRHHVVVALNNESTIKFEKHPRDILKATVRYYQAQPQSRGWVEVEAVPPPRDQGECDARTFQREDDEEQQINALICKYNEEIESDITKPMVYFWLEQPKGKKSELRFHFRHSDFFTFKLFIFVKVFHKNKPKTEYVCFPIQKKPRKSRALVVFPKRCGRKSNKSKTQSKSTEGKSQFGSPITSLTTKLSPRGEEIQRLNKRICTAASEGDFDTVEQLSQARRAIVNGTVLVKKDYSAMASDGDFDATVNSSSPLGISASHTPSRSCTPPLPLPAPLRPHLMLNSKSSKRPRSALVVEGRPRSRMRRSFLEPCRLSVGPRMVGGSTKVMANIHFGRPLVVREPAATQLRQVTSSLNSFSWANMIKPNYTMGGVDKASQALPKRQKCLLGPDWPLPGLEPLNLRALVGMTTSDINARGAKRMKIKFPWPNIKPRLQRGSDEQSGSQQELLGSAK